MERGHAVYYLDNGLVVRSPLKYLMHNYMVSPRWILKDNLRKKQFQLELKLGIL